MIIFVVGGTTYEESRSVALQNASNSGVRFLVGGSVVLNSKRYAYQSDPSFVCSCHFFVVACYRPFWISRKFEVLGQA